MATKNKPSTKASKKPSKAVKQAKTTAPTKKNKKPVVEPVKASKTYKDIQAHFDAQLTV